MSLFNELKRRNVIRVGIAYVLIAWVVLQGADFGLDLIDAPNWVIQALFLLVAIGLPAVLVFAWVFEMTPEGIKLEKDVDRSRSIAPLTGHKLDRVIIGILTIAVAVLLLERFVSPRTPAEDSISVAQTDSETHKTTSLEPTIASTAREKSIAVLPLANRSIRPEDAFFAEGMHDELLTQLSRISALKVISRTSVMGYAGTTKRMTEIGSELGVATLLEGGVQRAGDRVRINVQLIDAATDEHLWAEVYDRELTADNLFDIQSDITTAIAGALEAVLTGEEQQLLEEKLTDNVEAYGHYLRARANAAVYGREVSGIDTSIASYQRAIELDPEFAAAYAALSIDWSERHWISPLAADDSTYALKALERAQALAPGSVETLTAAGYYHYWCNKDYEPSLEAFDRAILSKPGSALAMRGRAYVLRRMGRIPEAVDSFNQVISLDPLHAQMRVDMAYALVHTGEILQALASVSKANAIGEPSSFGLGVQANILAMLGRFDEAWKVLGPPHPKLSGYQLEASFNLVRLSGNPDWAELLIEHLASGNALITSPLQDRLTQAGILRRLGQTEKLESIITDIGSRLDELARDSGHAERQEGILISQARFYALRGDHDRLQETVDQYQLIARPDALHPVEEGVFITLDYAMVGDFERAFERIEKVADEFGPWEFARYGPDSVFDPVREDPRFKALETRYQDWLESIRQ